MSDPMTIAPSAANRSAQAKPIPDAAPVTYATLPSRRPMRCSFVGGANIKRMRRAVAGVDGCRDGWVVVTAPLTAGPSTVQRVERLDALIDRVRSGAVVAAGIDMPIGLPSHSRRTSDAGLRVHLGARRSSLFPTPP